MPATPKTKTRTSGNASALRSASCDGGQRPEDEDHDREHHQAERVDAGQHRGLEDAEGAQQDAEDQRDDEGVEDAVGEVVECRARRARRRRRRTGCPACCGRRPAAVDLRCAPSSATSAGGQASRAVLAAEPGGLAAQDDRGEREADQPLQRGDEHREDGDGGEPDAERRLLHDDHRDGAAAQRAGSGDDEVEGLRIAVRRAAADVRWPKTRAASQSAMPMPSTVEAPMRNVFHCFLKSSRLIIVPRWTMMKPTTTPASARSERARQQVVREDPGEEADEEDQRGHEAARTAATWSSSRRTR